MNPAKHLFAASAATFIFIWPASAQNIRAGTTSAPPASESITASPGSYAIPGTAPNPLAKPETLPESAPPAPPQTNVTPAQKMPPAIRDDRSYNFLLFDLLEYRPNGRDSDVRWDIEGWQGSDYRRFFIKSEGTKSLHGGDLDGDFQLLTGRLTKPWTTFQYGLRFQAKHDGSTTIGRPMAAVAVQSRIPYNYEIEYSLYLDPKGKVSGDFTATKDILLSQRLILQGRLEAEAALQDDERFGVGSGLNSVDVGLRLRYEIRREFAPYIGLTYGRSYGHTATLVRRGGGDAGQAHFVAGVRAWF